MLSKFISSLDAREKGELYADLALDLIKMAPNDQGLRDYCHTLQKIAEMYFGCDPSSASLLSSEREMLDRGDWIRAVKSVRYRTSLGLKEAKDLCDRYRR
jgi:hypothetical protein